MQRLTISASLSLVLFLVAALPGLVTGARGQEHRRDTRDLRAGDLSVGYRLPMGRSGQNSYAQTYVDTYTYDDAAVTVTYETGEPTFTGHLSATNLKPNFAYQLKIVGKPRASSIRSPKAATTQPTNASGMRDAGGRWRPARATAMTPITKPTRTTPPTSSRPTCCSISS